MKGDKGWIKLHREIMDTKWWLSESFTRAQAWVDLLLLANHTKGHIRRRGIIVEVERGAVGYSEDSFAKRWNWSRGKVRRFFQELIENHSILRKTVQKKTSVSNLIYIINYDAYQASDTENGTEDGRKTVQEQELKELKHERKKDIRDSLRESPPLSFENFIKGTSQNPNFFNQYRDQIKCVAYFIDKFKDTQKDEHPRLRSNQWLFAINNIFYVETAHGSDEINLDECRTIIDAYFKKKYQERCDYHLPHFLSEGVKKNLFYEGLS